VDDFYRKRIESQLARLRQAEQKQTRAVEIDRGILSRAASRASVADISISGLAEAIADALNAQRREILEHTHRLFKLAQAKALVGHDDERSRAIDRNLHRRVTMLESELRQSAQEGHRAMTIPARVSAV
jgi:hypothetical protein